MRSLLLIGMLALSGCVDDLDTIVAPVIDEIRPTAAAPGGTLTIIGRNFGRQGPFDTALMGGVEAEVLSWDDSSVRLVAPRDGRRGVVPVVIRTEGRVSRPADFEILSHTPPTDARPMDDAGDAFTDASMDAGPDAR